MALADDVDDERYRAQRSRKEQGPADHFSLFVGDVASEKEHRPSPDHSARGCEDSEFRKGKRGLSHKCLTRNVRSCFARRASSLPSAIPGLGAGTSLGMS